MKKQHACLIVMMSLVTVYSLGQEVITVAKNKKKYVSEQQRLELDGELVVAATDLTGVMANLSQIIFGITKRSLNAINDHVDGEKCSLTKGERTVVYEKMLKLKKRIERCSEEMRAMYGELVLLNGECDKDTL